MPIDLGALVRFYARGRLHGIPRCCCLRFAVGRATGRRPSEARRQVARETDGRVPCELHLWAGWGRRYKADS